MYCFMNCWPHALSHLGPGAMCHQVPTLLTLPGAYTPEVCLTPTSPREGYVSSTLLIHQRWDNRNFCIHNPNQTHCNEHLFYNPF
jgi:hypothetical protein